MANEDIRGEIAESGVRKWQIADKLGICISNFSVKLRHELPDAQKEKIRNAIQQIKQEMEESA